MSAGVGDKLVCVDDRMDPLAACAYDGAIVKGRIYVVREAAVILEGILVFRLVGIRGIYGGPELGEVGFHAWRFRPLSQLKATVSVRHRQVV